MAMPVGFEGADDLISGEHIPNCADLPAFRCKEGVISCWRLDEEELKLVQETGVMWVMLHTHVLPPMSLQAQPLVMIGDRPARAEPVLVRAQEKKQ